MLKWANVRTIWSIWSGGCVRAHAFVYECERQTDTRGHGITWKNTCGSYSNLVRHFSPGFMSAAARRAHTWWGHRSSTSQPQVKAHSWIPPWETILLLHLQRAHKCEAISAARPWGCHAAPKLVWRQAPLSMHACMRLICLDCADDVSTDRSACCRVCLHLWVGERVCGVCQSPLPSPPLLLRNNKGDGGQSRCLRRSAQPSSASGLIPPANNQWRKEKREVIRPSVCLSVSLRLPGIPVEMFL